MGLLKDHIKEKEKKSKVVTPGSVEASMAVPTGIDYLDYMSGYVDENDDGEEFYNLGIPQGKITLYVGHSQSGKSTKAYQDAYTMAKELNGDVVIFDFERSTQNLGKRVMAVTGCSKEEFEDMFSLFKQEDLTVEYMKQFIFDIVEKKAALAKKCHVEYLDYKSNPLNIFPPTIIIIDSISAIRPKELLDNPGLDNNMVAATIAKNNSAFLSSINHLLEPYNITLLCIGHITKKIIINQYAPKSIQLPGLADDENISGGNKFCFLASYAFKFTAGAELKQDKEMFIKGRFVNAQILKSRSGYNEKKVPIIFTAAHGFSNELTNYMLLKEEGKIKTGTKCHLVNMPEFKFSQKDFLHTYTTNKKFANNFDDLVYEVLDKLIRAKESTSSKVETSDLDEEFSE